VTENEAAQDVDVTQDATDTGVDVDVLDDAEDAAPASPWQVSFAEWVQEHFATVEFFTADPKIKWCPTWWEHPEAVARLKALWAAYLGLAEEEDPSAVSSWWLHHWDAHRAILFHDAGPFRNCSADRGHLTGREDKRIMPYPEMPPEGWRG